MKNKKGFNIKCNFFYIMIFLLSVISSGCRNEVSPETKPEYGITSFTDKRLCDLLLSPDVLRVVRELVLKQVPDLSEQDKSVILKVNPEIARYKMAATFGQYGWRWEVPSGHIISVAYMGDITPENIDTSKMKISFHETDMGK